MKFFKYIILSAAVAMFASCETDLDTVQINNPEEFVAPEIKGEYGDITVTAANAKTESVEFAWSAADFGLPTEVIYSVYLSYGDKSALLGQKKETKAAFTYEDINSIALSGLGIAPNATGNVSAYVTAKMAGTNNYEPIVSAKSNSFNVTTYEVPVKAMYLVGEINGWKDGIYKLTANIPAKSIEMTKIESISITGAFNNWGDDDRAMTYNVAENVWESAPAAFGAGEEFLIRLNKNFDLKYGSSGKNSTAIADGIELVASGGNNIAAPAAGTYVVKFYANRTPCVVKMVKQ